MHISGVGFGVGVLGGANHGWRWACFGDGVGGLL